MDNTIQAYRSAPRQLFLALLVSLLGNIAFIGAYYLAAKALANPMSWTQTVLIVPMVVLANSLPISIGGLGVGETASEVLLTQLGVAGGAAMVLLVRITAWSIILPIGSVFYILEKKQPRQSEPVRESDS